MSVSKIWIKLCVGFPLIPGGVWCLMWAHPWKLVKTHHVGEEERWNKCFYVWNHGIRIPSHHNSCALITEDRQGSVLVTKARSHKACANVPASKIASVGSIGGGLSQQSNSWYNMSYAGVYISLYTPLSPIASVGSIQGSESAVIRWATVTAGEPSLLCNECTARLLTLELNVETWGSNGLRWLWWVTPISRLAAPLVSAPCGRGGPCKTFLSVLVKLRSVPLVDRLLTRDAVRENHLQLD